MVRVLLPFSVSSRGGMLFSTRRRSPFHLTSISSLSSCRLIGRGLVLAPRNARGDLIRSRKTTGFLTDVVDPFAKVGIGGTFALPFQPYVVSLGGIDKRQYQDLNRRKLECQHPVTPSIITPLREHLGPAANSRAPPPSTVWPERHSPRRNRHAGKDAWPRGALEPHRDRVRTYRNDHRWNYPVLARKILPRVNPACPYARPPPKKALHHRAAHHCHRCW